MTALRKIIAENKEKNIPGDIKDIDDFKTWFNENLAIVISLVHDDPSRYKATLVIYEPAKRSMNEILVFKCIASDSKLDKVKEKIIIFKRKLNEDNPTDHFTFPETIIKIKL